MRNDVDRILLVVLDGLGIGGRDPRANSLSNALSAVARTPQTPFLDWLGLRQVAAGNADSGAADLGRMRQESPWDESYSAHWEMAGINNIGATGYPDGLPRDFVEELERAMGVATVGNLATYPHFAATPANVLEAHIATGSPILICEDSPQPVAVVALYATEDVLPRQDLFSMVLRAARVLEEQSVRGRLCARTFERRDGLPVLHGDRLDIPFFKLDRYPLLDAVRASGRDCVGTGKVAGLFGNRGFSQFSSRWGDEQILEDTYWALEGVRHGLIWANFNTLNRPAGASADPVAWIAALELYDTYLQSLYGRLSDRDLLVVTGDHGCDPTLDGSHTREDVPLLAIRGGRSSSERGASLGLRRHSDVAKTIEDVWGLTDVGVGQSFGGRLS